jgi:hypothetical protein
MITTTNFGALMGAPVLGPEDEKIGTVGQVFVDPSSGRPNWMTVHTGLFGRSESFVPVDTAEWDHERVHIEYSKDFIKDAPRIDTDGALSQSEEDELYRYYGMSHDEDGDRQSETGVGSDDASGGSPSAFMDTEGGPNSERPTGSDYSHTGTGRVGGDGDENGVNERDDSDAEPHVRMRRFVVTEVYVDEDGSETAVGTGSAAGTGTGTAGVGTDTAADTAADPGSGAASDSDQRQGEEQPGDR